MYLNSKRISSCRIAAIIKIILGGLLSAASISVTLDYFKPSSGKDSMDKVIAIGLTALFLWLLINGIKGLRYLSAAASYGELFASQRERDILTCKAIGQTEHKTDKRVAKELNWLIKKVCLINCRLQKGTETTPDRHILLEGSNIVHFHYVKVKCQSCGAENMIIHGQTGKCDYCGSILEAPTAHQ
ncbi:MAG: hypothetical protein IJ137_08730 [Eubacterium sp.]|nr:hypothetical protein [Eubacterium sp.]